LFGHRGVGDIRRGDEELAADFLVHDFERRGIDLGRIDRNADILLRDCRQRAGAPVVGKVLRHRDGGGPAEKVADAVALPGAEEE
jgi:hypothetical protein